MNKLTYDKSAFYLDGKPFRIIAGDIHYFRIHEKDWENRLSLAVDFGLNTIQTYVPWNAHEPRPGEFDFSGMLNLGAFLTLCKEKGLKVLLRPAPYICSEWDFGGLPAWLLKDRELTIRTSEHKYLCAVQSYYDRLLPEFIPYLATNGGPIIAVAVENEYGSYGNDKAYMNTLADMLRKGGVDVPLYTTDGDLEYMLEFGRTDDTFFGVNYRAKPGTTSHARLVSDKSADMQPFFIGEFWAGRSMHWGEPFRHRIPKETADAFKEALEHGANVCFYMFSGGTNFGFMSGANIGRSYSPRPNTPMRYIPHSTSYSEDTMISENGCPTEKYRLCKTVLDEYLGKKNSPPITFSKKTQNITVSLAETADLFENLDALTECCTHTLIPKPMEDYDQNYGLILYTTKINAFNTPSAPLHLFNKKYKDRVNIYVENEFFATFLRDRGLTRVGADVSVENGLPLLSQREKEIKIDVLAENIGRINFGSELPYERKGLEECLIYGIAKLIGYNTKTIPLKELSKLKWTSKRHKENMPCFFRGIFNAKPGVDAFIDIKKFGHGYIWINGFNLGRYDDAGPFETLYLPGYLLNETENELIVLDIAPIGERSSVSLIDHEILEGDGHELN